MKKRFIPFLAAALLALGANTSQAEKYELNYQTPYSPAHTIQKNVMVPWCDEVSAKHPDLKIVLYATGAILESKEVQDGLTNGMLDMASFFPTMDPKKYPASMLGNLPMISDNSTMGTSVAWRLMEEVPEYKADLEKCADVLTIWAPASTGFFSVKDPIRSPEDLKGKRILTNMPADVPSIKALGGIPVVVTPGDVYVGLQRGMGEAIYTAWPMANGLRLDEVCKYATACPFASSFLPMGISKMTAENLPKDILGILKENTGKYLSGKVSEALDQDVEGVKKRFKDAGVEIIELTPESLEAFQSIAKGLVDSYWIPYLESIGLQNAKELVAKTYAISDEVRASLAK